MPKIKNIYQDKKTKKWFFRAYLGIDENGRKVQKTKRGYASQKDAKIAYDKYMETHDFNKTVPNQLCSTNQMTFEEFYKDRFVKWYERQVKSQTYENAQFIFEKRMQFFYHFRVRDITSHDIEDWLFELSQTESRNSRKKVNGETLSKSYINRIRGHLKIVLDRAVKEGVIAKNPVEDVSSLPSENKKVEFWEHSEFLKVMNELKDDKIQTHQMGKKLSLKLRQWYDLQKRIGNFEYVAQLDGTFTPPYSFANWLKGAAKKAGVKPIKLHALRHSHVAFLIEQNIQPLSIQERLGHANIQITLGTYGHLYAKSDQQVVNAIDNVQEGAILSKNDNLLPV